VELARIADNHLAVIHASAGLAAIHAERGDLDTAEALATRALRLAEEHSLDGHWATAMARVVQGLALERRGLAERAAGEIERAAELSRQGVASVEIAYSLLSQAESQRLRGDADAAAELAAEARGVVQRCPDPGILTEMLARTEGRLRPAPQADAEGPRAGEELTARELEVLRLLPGQLSQRAIGEALYVSLNTIKTHVRGIYRKLEVETRDEAVERARELELI